VPGGQRPRDDHEQLASPAGSLDCREPLRKQRGAASRPPRCVAHVGGRSACRCKRGVHLARHGQRADRPPCGLARRSLSADLAPGAIGGVIRHGRDHRKRRRGFIIAQIDNPNSTPCATRCWFRPLQKRDSSLGESTANTGDLLKSEVVRVIKRARRARHYRGPSSKRQAAMACHAIHGSPGLGAGSSGRCAAAQSSRIREDRARARFGRRAPCLEPVRTVSERGQCCCGLTTLGGT
jgi:hypothetical protein